MSTKKSSPEAELEKQYRDYKAQFEQWKERNSESVGSEAYVRYVKQFEDWERDVEKRRAMVKEKAEQERIAAEQELHKKQQEADRLKKQNEEAEIRQRAIQQAAEQQQRLVTAKQRLSAASAQAQPSTSTASLLNDRVPREISSQKNINQNFGTEEINSSMANVMQQMLNFVMVSEKQNGDVNKDNLNNERVLTQNLNQSQNLQTEYYSQTASNVATHQTQQQVATVSSNEPQSPPQLWGSDGVSYPVTDPMFRRWNVRAAPPNFRVFYEPPPPTALTNPYWLLLENMKEKKLVIAPNFKQPPPLPPSAPIFNNLTPASVSGLSTNVNIPPTRPSALLSSTSIGPPMPLGNVSGHPPIGPPLNIMPPLYPRPPHMPPRHPHHMMPPPNQSGLPPSMISGPLPPMFHLPPPHFRMPPGAANAPGMHSGPPPSYYKIK